MKGKIVSGIMMTLLLIGMLTLAFDVQPVKPVETWAGTVYVRADGSVDPPDSPIVTYDNVTYTLTGNITSSADGIAVERDNIIIDGAGYTVQGTGARFYKGVDLTGRTNVTTKKMNIQNFHFGIWLGYYSSNNIVSGNNITDNGYGIELWYSSNNIIHHNNFIDNAQQVRRFESTNIWDDGYPSGGNYWSDYTIRYPDAHELDDSGIWDTPYVIDENNRDRYPLMNPVVPDVAVVSVVPSATEVYVGWKVNITVVVKNEGKIAETFTVKCKYELEGVEHLIGTQTVNNLAPHTSTTLTFTWKTTDVTVHTLKAEAAILLGETDTADNTMTSPTTVKVKILGDVNNDDKVDIRDIAQAAQSFGSYPGHKRWNIQADINQDNKVDIRDLALIAKNFGKKYP